MSPGQPQPFATVVVLATVPEKFTYRISASTVVRSLDLRNVVGVLPGHDPQRGPRSSWFSRATMTIWAS